MGAHDPGGALLCVHSVCVAAPERRRGLAARMLRAYLPYVQTTTPGAAEVRLLCKAPLESLYRGAGFAVVGPSAVVHGAEPWTEMALEFE
jgi:predicted GNAT family N-acyltransferase